MAGSMPRPKTIRRRFISTTICRRAGRGLDDPPAVVPANAGAHNHRPVLLQKVSHAVPERKGTAYGSLRSQGRRRSLTMNTAPRSSNTDQPGAHLRLVADRATADVPGITLSGVSKTYRSRDGDVP